MRLSVHEREAIKREAAALLGADAVVRLFGSRVDDRRRGGDIDLHLEVAPGGATLRNELAYTVRLHDALGEQKIDVVLHERGAALRPIDRIALEHGVIL